MEPTKDHSNFYATAAQVIPVMVLIFVVEARGFSSPVLRHRWFRLSFYFFLFLAFMGEILAIVLLRVPEKANGFYDRVILSAVTYSTVMAAVGVARLIQNVSDERDTG